MPRNCLKEGGITWEQLLANAKRRPMTLLNRPISLYGQIPFIQTLSFSYCLANRRMLSAGSTLGTLSHFILSTSIWNLVVKNQDSFFTLHRQEF